MTSFYELKDTIASLPTVHVVDKFRNAIPKSTKLTEDEKEILLYRCDARESVLWFDSYQPASVGPEVRRPLRFGYPLRPQKRR